MLYRMDISDLPERLRRIGKKQADLSRFTGIDPSSLTKTINGTRQLKADELLKIEEFFSTSGATSETPVANLAGRRRAPQTRVPVYGYAAPQGDEHISFSPDKIIDWIDPPPFWSGAGDLVAVRALGDSMEPRLFAGEIAIAHIGLSPGRGRDCLIEFTDGTVQIKVYKSQKDGQVFVQQFNPDRLISIPATKVRALHAITWRN
ncbi:S24 family peptidase [Caulobacter sp. BK020]|uniref:LexA family transcriptional regulator n=1 Tax=Caulobacter sp. BK020 TaxID=2512117 RepID=UPI0010DD0E77|nr:S24 family peptidase [Caulobacter sp. BK020]TCS14565.1 peptidase S24-like protein [Caulobacter sp. BK020]